MGVFRLFLKLLAATFMICYTKTYTWEVDCGGCRWTMWTQERPAGHSGKYSDSRALILGIAGYSGPGPILEPEAGTGALVGALLHAGYPPQQITVIERHSGLFQTTCQRFTRIHDSAPSDDHKACCCRPAATQ